MQIANSRLWEMWEDRQHTSIHKISRAGGVGGGGGGRGRDKDGSEIDI